MKEQFISSHSKLTIRHIVSVATTVALSKQELQTHSTLVTLSPLGWLTEELRSASKPGFLQMRLLIPD